MDGGRRQILGLALAINGVLGTIMICALPAWKVFINTVYHHGIYGACYGLWKICTIYTTGKMECVEYEVFAPLVDDTMKAIRALVIIAILSGIFGILLGVAGNKRINFMLDDGQKRKVGFASGVVFIIAGFLVFIPVCWMANIIIRDSYELRNHGSDASIKLGASLYIGWFTTGFLFLGGGLLLYRQE